MKKIFPVSLLSALITITILFLMGGHYQGGLDISKVDDATTLGLLGVNNSLAYRTHEIEKHFHNSEIWLGAQAVPVGETEIADDITDGTLSPFQIDAGNDAWGSWVQIKGSSDGPYNSGVKFDLHKIQIVDSETSNVHYFIQIGCDASGADALTNGNYTTIAYLTPTNQAAEAAINFMIPRFAIATKCWARGLAVGENTCTLDFYIGWHEYAG